MEKVYVLTINQVYNFEELDTQPFVCATREMAEQALKEFRDDEMETLKDKDWDVEEDSESRFCIMRDSWNENHTEAIIWECDVLTKG